MSNNEMLHFYRGHPVTVYVLPEERGGEEHPEKVVLGPHAHLGQRYFHVVPRGRWFVRRLEKSGDDGGDDDDAAIALIGCTVVPGYDDRDIETKTIGEIRREDKGSK